MTLRANRATGRIAFQADTDGSLCIRHAARNPIWRRAAPIACEVRQCPRRDSVRSGWSGQFRFVDELTELAPEFMLQGINRCRKLHASISRDVVYKQNDRVLPSATAGAVEPHQSQQSVSVFCFEECCARHRKLLLSEAL